MSFSGPCAINNHSTNLPNFDLNLLYIYSDVAEPQIVGNTVVHLLRVITVKRKDGEMVHKMFDKPILLSTFKENFSND